MKEPPNELGIGMYASQTKFGQGNFLQAIFFQKSIMFGRTEHKLEIKALSMKATQLVNVFGIDDAVRA